MELQRKGIVDTGKVNDLMRHGLMRLREQLESRRLSALRSTLGLAVPYAAIRSLESGTTGGAPSHGEEPNRSAAAEPAEPSTPTTTRLAGSCHRTAPCVESSSRTTTAGPPAY
jgi:hypothetical protein